MAGTRKTAFYRGSAGRERADEELVKQKARQEARREQQNQPFRFRVKVGDTAQYVILDDEPDFFRFEHNMKNPATGFWDTFTGCTKEWDNCPVCEALGKEPYYALYLSVLDLTPFETRDGVKHDFSRKLLVVKPAQQKKFQRAFQKREKEGLTLRGAIFEVTRDGDKDSSIGNDIEMLDDIMDEDELQTYVRNWKDREGKKHTEACFEVYDYEELFGEPDSEELRALMGTSPAPGSRAHEDRELGGRASTRRGRAEPEERPARGGRSDWKEAGTKERMPTRGTRRAAEPEDEPEDEPAEPARRPARGAAARPAAPAARRGRAEPEDEPEDEAPPPRRGAARAASAPAPRASTRRAARDEEPPFDPDDDPEDDRPAPGVGRRTSLRGKR